MSGKQRLALSVKERESLIVGAAADEACLKATVEACDLIELRMDSLPANAAIKKYAHQCHKPLLITARGPLEGGQHQLTVDERRHQYLEMIPYAAAIDIELSSHEELSDVIEEAKAQDVIVVGSFHHFDKTPSLEELISKIQGPSDIFKFATMVNSEADLEIHRTLLESDSPLSVMGMGLLGAEARPEMIQRGSLLNYGYLGDTPTAPNQWPVAKLRELTR